jgi:hypothetical protein
LTGRHEGDEEQEEGTDLDGINGINEMTKWGKGQELRDF